MNTAECERLPNILQVFRSDKQQPPDNAVYKAKISHYLSVFASKNPQTVVAIIYETFDELLGMVLRGRVWKELFDFKKNRGKLRKIKVTWWEARSDRRVDAEFYLEHWKENYSSLAENWQDIQDDPDSLDRISDRIIEGIVGLLFVEEYEDTLFATLKHHPKTYQRLAAKGLFRCNPRQEYPEKYGWLVEEIAAYASSLPLDDGINFMGELSGAYILSCPAKYIRSDPWFPEASKRFIAYSSEELCVMVLLRYICQFGSQELARSASDFPLKCVMMREEERRYVIEIPTSI